MKDISEEVRAKEADPYELSQWLWNYFGGELSSSTREILISKNSTEVARAEFTKHHRLKALKVFDSSSERVAEIRESIGRDLLDGTQMGIGCEVLFSSFPVDGFFRFEDKLQICPVPPAAPRPFSRSWGQQPFLLEFEFTKSRNHFVSLFRRSQLIRHLSSVLAVFLRDVITVRSHVARTHWVNVPLNLPGEEPRLESRCLSGQYNCPEIKAQLERFSSTEGIPKIAEVQVEAYYGGWGRVLDGRPLEIPDSLNELLRNFFSLPSEERARFIRAAYWFAQAKSGYLISKSYVYIALVMAIEAVAERAVGAERCPSCRREMENGPTINFRRFLDRYATGPGEIDSLKRQLYVLRSELTHGGRLLADDMDNRFGPITTLMVEEDHKGTSLYRLTQIALINWLLERKTV